MTIGDRLKEERVRLGLSQSDFAGLAQTTKKSQIEYEKGAVYPNAGYLAAVASGGADVQYVITGERQGQGIGESAVFQAVLDAVDLLSLEKKVDAGQLAKAVVKLCARQASPASPTSTGIQIHGSQVGNVIHGDVDQSDLTFNVGAEKKRK